MRAVRSSLALLPRIRFRRRSQEAGRTPISGRFGHTPAARRRGATQAGRARWDGAGRAACPGRGRRAGRRRPDDRNGDQRMSVANTVPEHRHGLRGRRARQERDGRAGGGPRAARADGGRQNAVRQDQLLRQAPRTLKREGNSATSPRDRTEALLVSFLSG